MIRSETIWMKAMRRTVTFDVLKPLTGSEQCKQTTRNCPQGGGNDVLERWTQYWRHMPNCELSPDASLLQEERRSYGAVKR